MTEQLPLHGIAVYNPGILSKEELKRYFVARRPLLKKLLDELEQEQPGHTPQHRLIVGTRGMGKTTLLHRLALAVAEHPTLSTRWLPLTFPEEQYNIARLSDLWANCLDALGDALEAAGHSALLEELDRCVDELPDEENERAQTALRALMDFADRLGRRLLLLIDNLDIVLDRLEEAHWAIREVLGHEPRLLLIGASARVLEATYEYQAAFYDFFRVHELKGLSEKEMRELLYRLAEVDQNSAIARLVEEQPARLRTLHTLTGGNPRTAVLLYGVLAQGIEGDVRSDLERLLDHCTPLYKARFEELSPQAQKVVDAMAIHWDPLTARRLAEQTRLPVNTVSTQLTRLERQGVVEKVALKPGRKSGYQIAERFFNIWYLMRTSRRVRRRLIWLVQFLKVFYSQDELKAQARNHLRQRNNAAGDDRLPQVEYAFSLARAVEDPVMKSALESAALQAMLEDNRLKKELAALIDFDDPDGELKTRAERMEFMQSLYDRVISARDQWPEGVKAEDFASLLRDSLSLSPDGKRRVLEALPGLSDFQIVELIKTFNDEKRRWSEVFSNQSDLIAAIREAVARGYMVYVDDMDGARVAAKILDRGILSVHADLVRLEKDNASFSLDELHALRDSMEKFGIQYAWNNLGVELEEQGDIDGAIEAYRKQIEVKPDHDHAWNNLGVALEEQGDIDGAIEAYRKQIEVKPDHDHAWNNLGVALKKQGDIDGAIEAYRQGMQYPSTKGRCHNGLAWLYYEQQQNLDQAVALARKAVELEPDEPNARHTLATLLMHLGHWEEAQEHAVAFLRLGGPDWLESVWDDLLTFFREAVRHGRAAESARLLEETGNKDRLRPLHAALMAIAEGPDQLTRVAPEVRQPAEDLVKQLSDSDVTAR